jgi:hypothetical protein
MLRGYLRSARPSQPPRTERSEEDGVPPGSTAFPHRALSPCQAEGVSGEFVVGNVAGARAGAPVTALEVGGEEARGVDAARERAGEVPALVPRAEVVHRVRGCPRRAGGRAIGP